MAGSAAVPGVDPSRVSTPDELAACLDGLRRRRGLSYEAMEKAAVKLLARPDGSRLEPLAKSTVGEIVTGKRLPARGKLLTFLAVCEVAPADLAQWLAAWERANTADLARPAGGVRVRDARPRLLGVHKAISVPGVPDDVPPEYVPRDTDTAEFGVRAKVATAAQKGGFVLLVGGSSVGKTRCAAEAVKALLPDWWLVHPAEPAEVAALAASPVPRVVVWLDELQRYLDGEHGLTGGVVRTLLIGSHPMVLIGTLRPDWYPVPALGGVDPHAREREVLDLADTVRIGPEFSEAEQKRARAAAERDRRLAVAMEAAGYGLTQTLAAAPQLVSRWEDAQAAAPYAWAVLTAALDVARLGVRAPLGARFLQAAAPDYCNSAQQAEAPDNWFEQALAYATTELRGAAAALSPAGAGMGQIAGYTVADYLLQYASRERRFGHVPASTWDAALSHVRDPADARRLAGSARNRLLYRYAIPLYRHAADADDEYAALLLADLLERRGDLDGAEQLLRARADAGAEDAGRMLVELLADRGNLDEAKRLLRALDPYTVSDEGAAIYLDDLLAKRRNLDELRAWADAGDMQARMRLAARLIDRGDMEGAEQLVRRRGMWATTRQIRGLLDDLLARRADLDEAKQLLRDRVGLGDGDAAQLLDDLLAREGNLDQLRARADAGDGDARRLAGREALDQGMQILRVQSDAGDDDARQLLAELLIDRGDLDEAEQLLRARADTGNGDGRQLANLLAQRGQVGEAERLRRFGLNPDGSIACG